MNTKKNNVFRTMVFALMVLFASGIGFSQVNEVYTEVGTDIITKAATPDSNVQFGGFYSDSRAKLFFDRFWIDGRIGAAILSVDEWDTVDFDVLDGITHFNAGYKMFWHSEIVVGTNYDLYLPGVYMYAYDGSLPAGRFGQTGATYVFSGIKPLVGLSMAVNVPFQWDMFSDESIMEANAAVYYESEMGLNAGIRLNGDLKNDFSMGAYVSGLSMGPFSWMAGYSYKEAGVSGIMPANHYIDTSMNVIFGKFFFASDFEIGFGGENDSKPMYTGLLAKFSPFSMLTAQLGVLFSVSDTSAWEDSAKSLSINPKVVVSAGFAEIGLGAEFLIADVANENAVMGITIPLYMKYWL